MGQAIVYSHRLQGKSIEFVMANTQTAVLGGGCFWCVEAALQQLEGVLRIESGYMGGDLDHPTYEQVCAGNTGHVEVVRVEFDPAIISYSELLEVFFTAHHRVSSNLLESRGISSELLRKQLTPAVLPFCRGSQGGKGARKVLCKNQA